MVVSRRERCLPIRPNEVWTLDFVADQLADGSRLRALTVVDVFSREALAIEVGKRLRGRRCIGAEPSRGTAPGATVPVRR